MAELALVRVDTHLIHSQVCRVWLKRYPAKVIIIIDDNIAADSFISQVYRLATPPGTRMRTMTMEQAASAWKQDQFGPVGPVFVLMSDIPTAYEVYKKGFDFPDLLIGWVGGTAGGGLYGPLVLTEEDERMLDELRDMGCNVFFPDVPAEYGV